MRAKFRTDTSGKAKGKQSFVMITHQVFLSEAFRHLDSHGRSLYLEVRYRYNGHNNGRIGFSTRDAAAALNISNSAAGRTFGQLVDHLLIERQGGGVLVGRLASEWTLTEARNDVTGEPASKAYLRWSPPTPGAPKKQKCVPPVGKNVSPMGRNGNGVPQKPAERPTSGTQEREILETASHRRDTYRYVPSPGASAPSRSASTQQASEGARATGTASNDGPVHISAALERILKRATNG